MFYVYQQTAAYTGQYVQVATNENKDAAIDAGKAAHKASGTCVVVTSADNANGRSAIEKPHAGVIYDSYAR